VYRNLRRKKCDKYKSKGRDKAKQAKWKYLSVNEHWQQIKNIMMETAQDICEMLRGPCKHKETCWCNKKAAEDRV